MAKIKVVSDRPLIDGMVVAFRAPCDCSAVNGLTVSYLNASEDFTFRDAHGNILTGLGNLFSQDSLVKAVLDVTNKDAYFQNADTNAYLEAKFKDLENRKISASDIESGALSLERGGTGTSVDLVNAPTNAIIRKLGGNYNQLHYTATANGAFYATAANGSPQFGTLPIAQGGTGATTAAKALANLRALNIDHITDNAFVVASGANLNNYTTPGVYKIISAAVAKTLVNCPYDAAGRLIVSAAAATESVIQIGIFNNAARYQVWFRLQTSDCIWGEWTRILMEKDSYGMVKLWENPSRTSSFAAQTISLDLSGYDEVLIYSCLEASRFNDHMVVSRCLVGERALAHFTWGDDDVSLHRLAKTSESGIEFGEAYNGGKKDNASLMPYRIYGLKGNAGGSAGSAGSGGTGADGFSPVAKVSQTSTGAVITITDKTGTTSATIVNGKDGAKGDTGATGAAGKNGVSATHSWNGTTLTITSASGTSSADLKGAKGEPGADGQPGLAGKSAYQYALDGGYTGTEAEFARKLASESTSIHIGSEPPEDENVTVWIDTDEEPEASGGAQADWNASEGEPGHVLNRTHYVEAVVNDVEWLAEQTFMFANTGGKNLCSTDNPIGESIVAGVKYTVVFDGEHYECVAHSTGQNIGNMSLTNASAEDTGEPFRIATINAGAKLQMFATTPGEHTISIYKVSEETVVHKLPVKFLPEGIGYKGKGEIANGSTELLDGELFFASETPLVVGKTYEVTYNGTDYSCTAFELDVSGDGSTMVTAIGNHNGLDYDGTGEPFVFIDCIALGAGGYQIIDFTGATEVTIRILGETVTHVPTEYLANAFPYYIKVYVDNIAQPTAYTCYDTVSNVEAVLKSGRQIAVKYTAQGGENIMFQILQLVLVYPTNYGSQLSFMCKGNILGAKSSENWVILKPQEDGTYLVDTTAFND